MLSTWKLKSFLTLTCAPTQINALVHTHPNTCTSTHPSKYMHPVVATHPNYNCTHFDDKDLKLTIEVNDIVRLRKQIFQINNTQNTFLEKKCKNRCHRKGFNDLQGVACPAASEAPGLFGAFATRLSELVTMTYLKTSSKSSNKKLADGKQNIQRASISTSVRSDEDKQKNLQTTFDVSVELSFRVQIIESLENLSEDDCDVLFVERSCFHKVEGRPASQILHDYP